MAKGITWPGYKGEPRTFAGFPGVYAPGVIVPLAETGMTEEEAKARLPHELAVVDFKTPPKTKGGE